jgi:hypothetical protein
VQIITEVTRTGRLPMAQETKKKGSKKDEPD